MDERLSRDLELLVDLFRQGGWQTLRLRSDALSLTLSHSAIEPGVQAVGASAPRSLARAAQDVDAPEQANVLPPSDIDPAWKVLNAPNLGTFYRSPKPGSPVFVEIGQRVDAGDELCLIEVMKLFTSVRADCAGIVRYIAVNDAELVESGQALMYIEAD